MPTKEDDILTIHKTMDYDLFVLPEDNRQIKHGHVEVLKESLKFGNFLNAFPIVVIKGKGINKGKLVILDGQHRYMAAQIMECYLYYIVSPLLLSYM